LNTVAHCSICVSGFAAPLHILTVFSQGTVAGEMVCVSKLRT